jgi:hypothetical protein
MDIVKEFGKQALVDKYMALVNAYPDFEENLQLESSAASVWLWPMDDIGQPSNREEAFKVYEGIFAKYSVDNPYMKTTKLIAAGAMADEWPSRSEELYNDIIVDYPESSELMLQAYTGLGNLAINAQNFDLAKECYAVVLAYNFTGLEGPDNRTSIESAMINAAVGLYWMPFHMNPSEAEEKSLKEQDELMKEFPIIPRLIRHVINEHRGTTSAPYVLNMGIPTVWKEPAREPIPVVQHWETKTETSMVSRATAVSNNNVQPIPNLAKTAPRESLDVRNPLLGLVLLAFVVLALGVWLVRQRAHTTL